MDRGNLTGSWVGQENRNTVCYGHGQGQAGTVRVETIIACIGLNQVPERGQVREGRMILPDRPGLGLKKR